MKWDSDDQSAINLIWVKCFPSLKNEKNHLECLLQVQILQSYPSNSEAWNSIFKQESLFSLKSWQI